jgi:hypothetical protein
VLLADTAIIQSAIWYDTRRGCCEAPNLHPLCPPCLGVCPILLMLSMALLSVDMGHCLTNAFQNLLACLMGSAIWYEPRRASAIWYDIRQARSGSSFYNGHTISNTWYLFSVDAKLGGASMAWRHWMRAYLG